MRSRGGGQSFSSPNRRTEMCFPGTGGKRCVGPCHVPQSRGGGYPLPVSRGPALVLASGDFTSTTRTSSHRPLQHGTGSRSRPPEPIDDEQVGAHARHTHGAERNRHEQYKQDGDREQREVTHVQPRHCASWSSNAQNSGATFFRARPMQTCLQRGGRGSSEYGGRRTGGRVRHEREQTTAQRRRRKRRRRRRRQ